ncbi:MAG: DUF3157 family protein [Vibrio sp.]
MMKQLFVVCLSLWSGLTAAAQIATLQDGRKVQLNNDFTWQYVEKHSQSKTVTPHTTPAHLASPVIVHTMDRAVITTDNSKPLLQLSRSDIDVVLGAANYQDGSLVIPTAITNQGQQSAIEVTIQWQLLNKQHHVVRSGTQVVWQSIKRMGSTYLRPSTSHAGKTLRIDVAADQYHTLAAKITNIELR